MRINPGAIVAVRFNLVGLVAVAAVMVSRDGAAAQAPGAVARLAITSVALIALPIYAA